MRLEQLQQIVEIEKQQSISKAARALYIAQPTLSGSLNSLEDEIGVRLFERTSSGVTPTTEGKEILQIAKNILEGCSYILNYGEKSRDLYGTVKLLITQAYGFLYSDILLEFKNRFPKAELDLQISMPEKIVEDIAQGNANIGVTLWELLPDQNQQVLRDADLQYETFGSHPMMLYVSQDNRFAENESVTLKELHQEQFVAYSSSYWAATNRQIQADSEALVMTDRENLKRIISTGQAVALMPETFALHDLYCEKGLIKLIPIKGSENFGTGVDYLIYPTKRRLTLLEQNLVNLLRDILNDVMVPHKK